MKITRRQLKQLIKEELEGSRRIQTANPSMEETDKSSDRIDEVPTTMDSETTKKWEDFLEAVEQTAGRGGDRDHPLTSDTITAAWNDSVAKMDPDDAGAVSEVLEELSFTASLEAVKAAFVKVVS
jgi:hypothetical protein